MIIRSQYAWLNSFEGFYRIFEIEEISIKFNFFTVHFTFFDPNAETCNGFFSDLKIIWIFSESSEAYLELPKTSRGVFLQK